MNRKSIKRGNIYYADLNPVIGSEQGETRPVLITQNDIGNKYSPTMVIVPITCKLKKKRLPTHILIPQSFGLEVDSLALVEQIRTIDNTRLREYIGRIDTKVQKNIDKALAVCIGIDERLSRKTE
jgi:mRNA interferase MazF